MGTVALPWPRRLYDAVRGIFEDGLVSAQDCAHNGRPPYCFACTGALFRR
jgi:hypothetical protein